MTQSARLPRTGAHWVAVFALFILAVSSTVFADEYFYDDGGGSHNWTVVMLDPQSYAQWHRSSRSYWSSFYSWWCGEEYSGSYEPSSPFDQSVRVNVALDSRPIALGSGAILLAFWEQFDTERWWDDCQVWVTTGEVWEPVRNMTWGRSGGWRLTVMDLSAYADQTVRLRFRFDTLDGYANDYPGWFLDDVRVYSSTVDSDLDGLVDDLEMYVYHTDPGEIDSDGDGLLDGNEVLYYGTNPTAGDTDGDGLSDREEVLGETYGFITDPLDPDSDGDGARDGVEVDLGRDPGDPTDGGGLSVLSGRITSSGFGLEHAELQMRGASEHLYHRALTDKHGAYGIFGVIPGQYYLRAGAVGFADEWYQDAAHRSGALAYPVDPSSILTGVDFDLAPGQSPALVEVTSSPTGAVVYLDYQPTTEVTPVVLDVGETASHSLLVASHCLAPASHPVRAASHTLWVRKTGRPWPSPRQVEAREAETVAVHFDLSGDDAGRLLIETVPAGAEVYVDHAEGSAGLSPIVVGNLAPGSHTVLLRKSDALRPQPIRASVTAESTRTVTIPLAPLDAPAAGVVVRSVPSGADIYVDYLPGTNVTDAYIGWLDPASHAGSGWHSVSHTILLRREGYKPAAPRTVAARTNEIAELTVLLIRDQAASSDLDGDGLPDEWEDSYGLNTFAPGANGRDLDADGDGATDYEEMVAGTDPTDPGSEFSADGVALIRSSVPEAVLRLPTIPGKMYVIQAAEDLESGWVTVSGVIAATSYETEVRVYDPEASSRRFFRALVLGGT